MYIARLLYPVEVLGPGKRVGIWFCGCPRRCRGCSNPELWEFQERYKTSPEAVYKLVQGIAAEHTVEGFTISGGDPMYQAEQLQRLIKLIRAISDDILVYTGYEIEDLSKSQLEGVSVLIDGAYIESRNRNCLLRGSDNQRIHILDERFREKYNAYCATARNQIQNFMSSDGLISVGIHKPGFIDSLNDKIPQRGLKENNE